MPSFKTHCIQSAVTSTAIYPFIGGQATAIVGISIVMIDVDHVIEYLRQTGSPKIWGVFPYCHIIMNNLKHRFHVLNLFHTIEFMLLIGLLGLLHPLFFFMTAGALCHIALDLLMLYRKNTPFVRALSVVEYFIRARKPKNIVRFNELLRVKGLKLPDDSWNYPDWIKHWQYCTPLC